MKLIKYFFILLICCGCICSSGCQRNNNSLLEHQDSGDEDIMVGMPNPFVQVSDIDRARKVSGINAELLKAVPAGFRNTPQISVLGRNHMVQMIYFDNVDPTKKLNYRVSDKLSPSVMNGDFNKYHVQKNIVINGIEIKVKGDDTGFRTVEWSNRGLNYCILSDIPLTETDIQWML